MFKTNIMCLYRLYINYRKASGCVSIHSWSQFIDAQPKWWKQTQFRFNCFGDTSKVCIKCARQLYANRGHGAVGICFHQCAVWLAGLLPGSSTLLGHTDHEDDDDDDDIHQGCSSLPPVHPTVGARGAGAQNGVTKRKEWEERLIEGERGKLRITKKPLLLLSMCHRLYVGLNSRSGSHRISRCECARWYLDQPQQIPNSVGGQNPNASEIKKTSIKMMAIVTLLGKTLTVMPPINQVSGMHYLGTISLCRTFHGILSSTCWALSVRTIVTEQPTDWPTMPSIEPHC